MRSGHRCGAVHHDRCRRARRQIVLRASVRFDDLRKLALVGILDWTARSNSRRRADGILRQIRPDRGRASSSTIRAGRSCMVSLRPDVRRVAQPFRSPCATRSRIRCMRFRIAASSMRSQPRRAGSRSSRRDSADRTAGDRSDSSRSNAAANWCRCHFRPMRLGLVEDRHLVQMSSSRSSVRRRDRRRFIATVTAIRRSQPENAAGSASSGSRRYTRRKVSCAASSANAESRSTRQPIARTNRWVARTTSPYASTSPRAARCTSASSSCIAGSRS